jgi:hypothetical protein
MLQVRQCMSYVKTKLIIGRERTLYAIKENDPPICTQRMNDYTGISQKQPNAER